MNKGGKKTNSRKNRRRIEKNNNKDEILEEVKSKFEENMRSEKIRKYVLKGLEKR